MAEVSAKIDFSSKGNIKKENVTFDGSVSLTYGEESMELKIDGSTEYTDVSIPELNSKNSIDVLKLDEEELENLSNDILKKAADVLPDRLKLIGVKIDKEDILPTSSTTTPKGIEEKSVETDETSIDEKDDDATKVEEKDSEASVDSSKTDINSILNSL